MHESPVDRRPASSRSALFSEPTEVCPARQRENTASALLPCSLSLPLLLFSFSSLAPLSLSVFLSLSLSERGALPDSRDSEAWSLSFCFLSLSLSLSLSMYIYICVCKDFGLSASQVGLVASSFAAGMFFAVMVLPTLSDRYGRRPVMVVAQYVANSLVVAFRH